MYRIQDNWGNLIALIATFQNSKEYKLISSEQDLSEPEQYFKTTFNQTKEEFHKYCLDKINQSSVIKHDKYYIKMINGSVDINIEQCPSSKHDTDLYEIMV